MTANHFPPETATKSQYRQYFKRLRASLDLPRLSQAICDRLQQWEVLQQAETVLAYSATSTEINLGALVTSSPHKTWGLPRTIPDQQLAWHLHTQTLPLQRSKLGILEPLPNSPLVELKAVDVVLVPALACDRQGIRLGYGAGYYDRCLALPSLHNCMAIGVVPSACFSPQALPCDEWDVPLFAVVTEEEIWLVEKS